jgi:hypothetical protein
VHEVVDADQVRDRAFGRRLVGDLLGDRDGGRPDGADIEAREERLPLLAE